MATLYKGGGHWAVNKWEGFDNVTTHAYPSGTHGNRFVLNYVNEIGAGAYGKYEDIGSAPTGTTVAKPSFTVSSAGQAAIGPLFIMEKMVNGFNAQTANWRYAMIMPGGATAGMTKGPNGGAVAFCHECHQGAEDADYLFFLPEDVRAK